MDDFFTIKITRPQFSVQFSTRTVDHIIEVLKDESGNLTTAFRMASEIIEGAVTADTDALNPKNNEPKKTRGKARGADPATAVAPEPLAVPALLPEAAKIPVPQATPPTLLLPNATVLPPNALILPADGGIPPFLQRAETPPALPSPPLAPAPPPVGVLGPKVVKALDIHRAGKADGGQALVDWLAHPSIGLVIKGQTYDEACRALLMMSDGKLAAVAQHLGVA